MPPETEMDQTPPIIARRRSDFRAGCRDIAPAAVAAVPIGLLFGAVAAGKGLSTSEVTLMSILVFAGGAQFAAIEAWVHPAPIAALAFTALLINARHILMGASLGPKLHATRAQKLVGFWFLTDETWAVAEHRSLHRSVTAAYWFGMVAVLPIGWIGSTAVGAAVGAFLGDPRRLGADFAFTALFIGLIAGFGSGKVTLITTAVSAAVAALVHTLVGAPWHVASGALAGVAAAYLASPAQDRQ
jgi:4-azaleucine resistance transporter AzlC